MNQMSIYLPNGFLSVLESVTLGDLEGPNGRYFALFHTIRLMNVHDDPENFEHNV